MKTMKFKCMLMSDIILSQTSSSEGNQKTLDFIPGNNFLGIVAAHIYNKVGKEIALDIFHSGKVRFGDAHPSMNGMRGLKVPASLFYPKLGKASDSYFIHHLIQNPASTAALQLKQCREGYYVFEDKTAKPVDIQKRFAIKSAYDSGTRRTEDRQMFGYESLPKGLELYFEIESDLSDAINTQITESLLGKKQIGLSRTAEYGLVFIERYDEYKEIASTADYVEIAGKRFITVYADSRLIFLDDNGDPTCQPKAKQLFSSDSETPIEGEIDWSKSQIRTFQYAPWNGKRHTYDTDRFGIEKGSVFVVELKSGPCPATSQYVGSYNNEGFGKVIYNPVFLKGNLAANGKAEFSLLEKESIHPRVEDIPQAMPQGSRLIAFLNKKKEETKLRSDAFDIVGEEVNKLKPLFAKGTFASQWGSIRSFAMVISNSDALIEAIKGYLEHGVAELKWEEAKRKETLLDFMNSNKNNNLQDIMINLASEMAKICEKREENKL